MKATLVCAFLLLIAVADAARSVHRRAALGLSWPQGYEPAKIGNRLLHNLIARTSPEDYKPEPGYQGGLLGYKEVAAAYGALQLAVQHKDGLVLGQIHERYSCALPGGSCYDKVPQKWHVDTFSFGGFALQMARSLAVSSQHSGGYRKSSHSAMRSMWEEIGMNLADRQFTSRMPEFPLLTSQSRFWCDDLWMISVLQLEAYSLTGNTTYLQHAVDELTTYLPKLQRASGLLNHSAQGISGQPFGPHAWGRANGWVAAALAHTLTYLPHDHAARPELLKRFVAHMTGLAALQQADGLWLQVVDDTNATHSSTSVREYTESSAAGMFVYAMGEGLLHGWLEREKFLPVVQRAWVGLCDRLTVAASVAKVCTTAGPWKTIEQYLDEPIATGDFHGQAGMLWSARVLERLSF